jgi:hypothetical protein
MEVLTRPARRAASAPPSWWTLTERQQQRRHTYEEIRDLRRQAYAKREERRRQGIPDTEDSDQEFAELISYLDTCADEAIRWNALDPGDPTELLEVSNPGWPWDEPQEGIVELRAGFGPTPIWDEISPQHQEIAEELASKLADFSPVPLFARSRRDAHVRALRRLCPWFHFEKLRSYHGRLYRPVGRPRHRPKYYGIVTLIHAQHAPPTASTAPNALEVALA